MMIMRYIFHSKVTFKMKTTIFLLSLFSICECHKPEYLDYDEYIDIMNSNNSTVSSDTMATEEFNRTIDEIFADVFQNEMVKKCF